MDRIDSTRAIEKIWNAECKNGQLLYWNYNEECWAIKDDLKLFAKYKRAFDILKDKLQLRVEDITKNGAPALFVLFDKGNMEIISVDEYELLEELMKNENR